MTKNNKQVGIKCSKCGKHLTRLESIIRGQGPICYGKGYTYKKLRLQNEADRHLEDKELDEKYGKQQILEMAKEEVKRYQEKKNRNKIRKQKLGAKKIRNYHKDHEQMNLDSFFVTEVKPEIETLREELYKITNTLSTHNSKATQDRALELMTQIKNLEMN